MQVNVNIILQSVMLEVLKKDNSLSDYQLLKYEACIRIPCILLYCEILEGNHIINTRTVSNYSIFKDTLMGNVNDKSLFHLGTRQEQIIMARLRMRSSKLKGHLYSMKIIESSTCS